MPSPADAQGTQTFTVNSTADVVDASPGDGVCETATGDQTCTLRAAIQESNASVGAQTVAVPSGTYQLSVFGTDEDLAAKGDLDVVDDLTLAGDGAATTILDAGDIDRALPVPGTVNFRLSDVTVRNGFTWAQGGGLYNYRGHVTLFRSTVESNEAGASGGGVFNQGWMTVEGSSITAVFTKGDRSAVVPRRGA